LQTQRLSHPAAPDYGKNGSPVEKSLDPIPSVRLAGDPMPDTPLVAVSMYLVNPQGGLVRHAE
jgi:hypothetical protein